MMGINKRSFTLTELLAGIAVAAIAILTVGAIGTFSFKTYKDLRNQSSVYNDAQFALELIRESVRQSTSAPVVAGTCLTVTGSAGTLYFYKNAAGTSLVYGSAACSSVTNKIIISGVTTLVFTPSISSNLVTVILSGSKSNIPFNFTIKAMRRNP